MASTERVETLKGFFRDWELARDRAAARRDWYIKLQSEGVLISSPTDKDVLQRMIREADDEARKLHEVCIRMGALVGLAESGEDV